MLRLAIDRKKRNLLIGGIVLLLLGVGYRFFPVFQNLQPSAEEIELKQRQIAKYQRTLQSRPQLEAKLESLTKTLQRVDATLLRGETSALAAVEIQNLLNEIGAQSQVDIKTMRVLKPETLESAGYLKIPVQVTLNVTARQLKEVLYKLETSPKLLKVTDIRVRSTRRGRTEEVQATLTVAGYMKNKET